VLARALPEVRVSRTGDHGTFFAAGRKFCWFLNNHHGDGMICVCVKVERELKVFSFAQMGYAVHGGVCNAMHNAEQRVSRWLTTAADLLGRAEIRLSQEELAHGLGLQRTALNPTLQRLKAEGLVEVARGRIDILASDQLKQRACECSQMLRRALYLEAGESDAVE